MPTRPLAHRLAAMTALSVLAFGLAACDEAVVEDPVTPSPAATRADVATPPPASQVAVDNSLGAWRSGPATWSRPCRKPSCQPAGRRRSTGSGMATDRAIYRSRSWMRVASGA